MQQPEQIGTLLRPALPTINWSETPQNSSALSKHRGEIVKQRFGSDDDFKRKVNPDTQMPFGKEPTKAVMGDYPTLTDIDIAYGKGFATEWLLPHIARLSMFAGAKNIGICQEKELAGIIANEYHFLKITEILLFFYRFRTGRYGRFYGTVDPLAITCALRDFIVERNDIIAANENDETAPTVPSLPKPGECPNIERLANNG